MNRKLKITLLVLLSGFMMYPYFLQSVVIVLVTILNLYQARKDKLDKNKIKFFLFINAWVFALTVSLLWTQNLGDGFKQIERIATFFLITLNFIVLFKDLSKDIFRFYLGFICFTWLALILHEIHFMRTLYITDFLQYLKTPFNAIYQIGVYDTPFILDFHKAYFSLYLLISIGFIFLLIKKKKSYIYLAIPLIHFIIEIIHMMSLINVLLLFLLIILIITIKSIEVFKDRNYHFFSLIVLMVVVFSGFMTYQAINDTYYNKNITKLLSFIEITNVEAQPQSRKLIWKQSISILKEHPFGVGVGDVQDELNRKYLEHGNSKLSLRNINSHNQYIYFLLVGGLIYFVIFITPFIYLLKRHLSRPIFVFIIIALVCNIALENFLYRINGIWLFGTMIGVLSINYIHRRNILL